MFNDLFSIGSFHIHTYGLMIGLAMLQAFIVSMWRAKKRGLDDDYLFDLGFVGIIAGIVGAKVLYWFTEIPEIIEDPSILLNLSEGFVVYGGIIAGIAAPYIYNRYKKRINFIAYLDIAIPSIPFGQALGRIGCLAAGCCYGRETTLPIGIVFPENSFAPAGVKLFPTQPLSSLGGFVISFILYFLSRQSRKKKLDTGMITAIYMILYSIGRFIIEFFRNDYRGEIGFLSTSQFISIFILLFGILFAIFAKTKLFERNTRLFVIEEKKKKRGE